LTYISAYRANIEVSRLSKDGGGTASSVVLEDVGACQLLLYISLLFPGALQRDQGQTSKFTVQFAPLLWEVRDVVKNHLNQSGSAKTKYGWKQFKDISGRELRSYQVDAIDEMIQKHQQGKKGHFLWLTVGLGKTLIVLSYLEYLNSKKELPLYLIYTLPKSALTSILVEI
jgi:hypothetical protein